MVRWIRPSRWVKMLVEILLDALENFVHVCHVQMVGSIDMGHFELERTNER